MGASWSRIIGSGPLAAALILAAATARADEMFASAAIGDEALKAVTGAALVNQAAGDGNLQLNGVLIAVNATGEARTRAVVVQLSGVTDNNAEFELNAVAIIAGEAFAGARGSILVTQGAGRHNQQVNLFAAALGLNGEIMLDAELSQTRSSAPPPEDFEPEGARFTQVAQGAFRDAAGVIQVNQVAGQQNATFNRFVLGVDAGSLP